MAYRVAANVITRRLSFALVIALFWGCSPSTPPADTSDANQTTAPPPPTESSPSEFDEATTADDSGKSSTKAPSETAERPPGSDPLVPQGITRNTTEGWWRIVFSINSSNDYPQDYSAGFLKIGRAPDGTYRLEELRTNNIINPAKAVSHNVTEKTVEIAFAYEDTKFDYAGTLDENVVRGNLQFESSRQNLVRLVPVAESDVTDDALDRQRLGASFGSEAIVAALQSESPVDEMRAAAETWSKSPVLYMGYDALIQSASGLDVKRPELEKLAAEFEAVGRRWGKRAEQVAKLNTAVNLLLTAYETDLAEQKLGEVRSEAPQLLAWWDELITVVRERGEALKVRRERMAAIAAAREQLEQGQTEEGMKTLRRLHAEQPVDAVAAYRLAAAEHQHGSAENALRLFARLAVLPQVEQELGEIPGEEDYLPPRVIAARLYEEQHGNRDNFEEFLREVYHGSITEFLTDEQRNRPPIESDRTSLVELFTGVTCPPCVAADVATEAIEHSFAGSDVVVLRYHVHNPGPDPLASADSEARNEYYAPDAQGTPTIFVDGKVIDYNVGGPYSNSPVVYDDLAETIVAKAAKPPRGSIELTAEVADTILRINASASAEEASDSLRLRLVIVESGISYLAYNGIREHEMVVREMPGGAGGIAAIDGKFSFEQEIPLVELRDRVDRYLSDAEQQLSRDYGQPFSFDERPLSLSQVKVVAFLQDDATREVLQAAIVPIEQKIELPPIARDESEDSEPAKNAESDAASAAQPGGPALSVPQ